MREVQRKIVDVRNPTHIVLKADEISADDVNNLSDSDNPSKLQIASQTELPNDEEQQGEEVKLERTTGEKVPVIESMSRTTPMDGKSHWDKAKGKYVFDATLKKTRNQLDMLKAPFDINVAQQDALAINESDLRAWAEEHIDGPLQDKINSDPTLKSFKIRIGGTNDADPAISLKPIVGKSVGKANKMLSDMYNKNVQISTNWTHLLFG